MSILARVFVLWLAVLASARATEREVIRKFSVQPGCTLRIDTHRGRVIVEEKDTTKIALTLYLETDVGGHEAQLVLDGVEFEAKQEGNTVSVRARNPRVSRALWVWQKDRQVDLDYKFTVPRQCSVDVTVGQGSITVGNLTGQHRARLDSGTIFFRRIEGGIDARVETGTIIVSRCSGAGRCDGGGCGGQRGCRLSAERPRRHPRRG
jgi:hypothetical protein